MTRPISYEAKINFMKESQETFKKNKHPSAVMMCEVIIEDLARLKGLDK